MYKIMHTKYFPIFHLDKKNKLNKDRNTKIKKWSDRIDILHTVGSVGYKVPSIIVHTLKRTHTQLSTREDS